MACSIGHNITEFKSHNIIHNIYFTKSADVNVGFQNLQFFTRENVSTKATVCAQIDSGSLEREIVVYLSTVAEGTAEGNYLISI